MQVRFFITFHCIFYIEESIVHNLLLLHEKFFVSNRKRRKRMKLSDDSTCISYREVIKGMTKAPSYVNEWKGKPNREVFTRRDPSWCLNQVIYRIASQHHIPQLLKISHLRKSRTSVSSLSSGASRTYSSLIDSLVDLLLPSTYLIAAIEAEFSYFICYLKYEYSTEQNNVFALALKKTFLFYNQDTSCVTNIF